MTSKAIMAELFGKVTGCSKGKGGSMHMFDKSLGFLGGHAIVGKIPWLLVPLSLPYQGTDQVTLCFFGVAAVNQVLRIVEHGSALEASCIYVVENNGMEWASLDRAMSLRDIAQKACAYEMASEFVDGMDVLAAERLQRAVEREVGKLLNLLEIAPTLLGHSCLIRNYRTRAGVKVSGTRSVGLFSASLKEEKSLTTSNSADR